MLCLALESVTVDLGMTFVGRTAGIHDDVDVTTATSDDVDVMTTEEHKKVIMKSERGMWDVGFVECRQFNPT